MIHADELALLYNYLLVAGMIFGIGVVGFVARRNMIVMFLSAEMMLQGISLSLVAWGRFHNDWGGQIVVLFIIAVAACEAAIALALLLMLYRRAASLDILAWQRLREDNLEPYGDPSPADPEVPARSWPHLTPAGTEPEPDEEQRWHRSHV